jgi:hypothetical protein
MSEYIPPGYVRVRDTCPANRFERQVGCGHVAHYA